LRMQTHLFMNSNRASQRRLFQAAALMLYTFALGLITNLQAATFVPTPTRPKTNAVTRWITTTNIVEAKVLVVNRDEQTFTVEYDGKMQLFRVEHGAKLFNAKGKPTTLDWITSGQTVLLKLQEYSTNRAGLLAATVLPRRGSAEAAGSKLSKAERKLKSSSKAFEPAVFPSEDARNHPLPSEQTDKESPVPEQPPVENPTSTDNSQPKTEDATPAPEPESKPDTQ
jgi:predicted NAD/FAD-binding protein